MKTAALLGIFASALSAAASLEGCSSGDSSTDCAHSSRVVTLDGNSPVAPDGGVDCFALCNSGFCEVNANGSSVTCHADCTGRRPSGLAEPSAVTASRTLGNYFAGMAYLESASIAAFRTLANELAFWGAPQKLVREARRAKRDEETHARLTRSMARRFGVEPSAPRIEGTRERSLADIAVENVVEGCVRETFGALVAHWQAGQARDMRTRAMMQRIARDETRHAELAWRTHRWVRSRLSGAEWQRVSRAMREAADQIGLAREEPPRELAHVAGVPGVAVLTAFKAALDQRLWAA